MNLSDLGIGRVARVLEQHGITTTDDLTPLNGRELGALRGMGAKSIEAVRLALVENNLELADDPWAPYVCARHGQPGWDVGLADLFLCDGCARMFEEDAFDSQPPEWVGSITGGYCLNCNFDKPDVRPRQWFLCGICARVVRSIGRSIVAARYLLGEWERVVTAAGIPIALHEIDAPVLRRRSRETIAAKVARADFVATNERDEPIFSIEMKTGRGYVRDTAVGAKIGTFQLDTSDCDDILAVVRHDRLPVYLAHVQVIDRAHAPTIRYEAIGSWWTDLFAMRDHFIEARMRPRESRIAAYYRTDMFRDIAELSEHLRSGGPQAIQDRIEREGIPAIYQLPSAG